VLLFLLEAGVCVGALALDRQINRRLFARPRRCRPLSLFAIFALLLFLFGRFSSTMARLEKHRLLRPSASFILLGAYICFLTALGMAGVKAEFPKADLTWPRACACCSIDAAEMLVHAATRKFIVRA